MRTHEPTKRLRDISIGYQVQLLGVNRVLTVKEVREDGYIDLHHGEKLVVTASPCHEIALITKN